jgi:hypothetical protein
MSHAFLAIIVLSLGVASTAGAETAMACRSRPTALYEDALSKRLDKMKIQYTRSRERGICVAKANEADLEKATIEVDSFHYEVAIKPRDACEERAAIAWLKQQGLPFVVAASKDREGRPSGNLIQLPAIVPEDVARYRQMLLSAPSDSRCPK